MGNEKLRNVRFPS